MVKPTFTARTSIMPPQQQQSAAATALASLSGLVNLTGVGAGLRSPVDQFVGLMQSQTVQDRLVLRFKLQEAYSEKLRVDARTELDKRTRISVGKRDGLLVIEVDDVDPRRAAAIANEYIAELRTLTSTLAVTEAKQRRVFFEGLLAGARSQLASAQTALEQSGVSSLTLRSDPKSAAEAYARLKAFVTAAEVRLQTLRSELTEASPEVRLQTSELDALRSRLNSMETSQKQNGGSEYITRYREFKYQETLFDLFARQYELARVDESREGALIQVVDIAQVPEKRSWPRRSMLAIAGLLTGLILAIFLILTRQFRSRD